MDHVAERKRLEARIADIDYPKMCDEHRLLRSEAVNERAAADQVSLPVRVDQLCLLVRVREKARPSKSESERESASQ